MITNGVVLFIYRPPKYLSTWCQKRQLRTLISQKQTVESKESANTRSDVLSRPLGLQFTFVETPTCEEICLFVNCDGSTVLNRHESAFLPVLYIAL